MFAKMENGAPVIRQQPLIVNGRKVYTNDPALWLSQGYKVLVETPRPDVPEGGVAVAQYRETETEIVREWVIL